MSKNKKSSLSIRFVAMVSVALASLGMSGSVLAAEGQAAESLVEEVVVTGSRLGVTEQSSVSPIKIIDRADLEELAVTSVGDFLQDLPQNIGGLNAQNNNGGRTVAELLAGIPIVTKVLAGPVTVTNHHVIHFISANSNRNITSVARSTKRYV